MADTDQYCAYRGVWVAKAIGSPFSGRSVSDGSGGNKQGGGPPAEESKGTPLEEAPGPGGNRQPGKGSGRGGDGDGPLGRGDSPVSCNCNSAGLDALVHQGSTITDTLATRTMAPGHERRMDICIAFNARGTLRGQDDTRWCGHTPCPRCTVRIEGNYMHVRTLRLTSQGPGLGSARSLKRKGEGKGPGAATGATEETSGIRALRAIGAGLFPTEAYKTRRPSNRGRRICGRGMPQHPGCGGRTCWWGMKTLPSSRQIPPAKWWHRQFGRLVHGPRCGNCFPG